VHTLHRIVVTVAAAACAASAQAQVPPSSATQAQGPPIRGIDAGVSPVDRDFMHNAARANNAELRASRLALARSPDPEARQFAQRMLDDHKRADSQLRQIAKAMGVQLPHDASVAQKAQLALLEAVDGEVFNQRYADEFGVKVHRQTIELFRKGAAQNQDAKLRAFASKLLPTLQEHLQMAQTLQASTHAPADLRRNARAAAPPSDVANVQAAGEHLRDVRQDVTESRTGRAADEE
jgi:putative membrane protein